MKDKLVALAFVGILFAGVWVMAAGGERKGNGRNNVADNGVHVKIPALTITARSGQKLFQNNCGQCHNMDASGTRQGPPLIHPYYRPGHHADGAFYRAAAQGVRAHHWRFGNMPPVTTVDRRQLGKIIAFIREVQQANGIF